MKNEIGSLTATELLEIIFNSLAELSSKRGYDEVIELLATLGKILSGADRCSVWIVSDDKKTIRTKVAHGIEPIEIPIESGIVGESIVSGSRYIIDDVYKDERFNRYIDKQTGYKTTSMMVIPMRDRDENVIGAFQVINRQGNGGIFDKRDMERLTLATTYAAETIISAKLTYEVEETQREVVFTMGAIGESRSKETGNHVKRVAAYSKLLALKAGLTEEEAELLKQASPMHDIGKVAIPDSILNKKGRFNEEERKIMDTHAQLGYDILKNSDRKLLQAASIVAHQHHEKYNGKGYPQGLKAEDIHIFGRITALADVYDALGSDRVYKKAWDDERIFKLFKDERGEHFDPNLIDIFFENIEEFHNIRNEFKDEYKFVEEKKEQTKHIKVLGAYGTKAKGFGTTSFALNKTDVIDAGNLLDALDEESIHVQNIWLTHPHLDHIVDIAYIIDNYYGIRTNTINILGTKGTIEAVQKHFLNDVLWPDFSKIKLQNDEMVVKYTEIDLDKEYEISQTESLKAFKTDHTDSSCGYIYKKEGTAILITADTHLLDNALKEIENDNSIKSIVVECSFPTDLENLAKNSKHLTPKLLFSMLKNIKRRDFQLYINHIKPHFILDIAKEIEEYKGDFEPILVKDGEILQF